MTAERTGFKLDCLAVLAKVTPPDVLKTPRSGVNFGVSAVVIAVELKMPPGRERWLWSAIAPEVGGARLAEGCMGGRALLLLVGWLFAGADMFF